MSNKAAKSEALCYLNHWSTTQAQAVELLSNPAFTQPFTITANLWDTNAWGSVAHKPPNAQPDMYTVYVTQCGGGVSQLWVGGWKTYSILSNGADWNDFLWIGPLATATKPKKYDLPLESGFEAMPNHSTRYSLNQFGEGRIWFAVQGTFQANAETRIATLPAGYRPDSIVAFSVHDHLSKCAGYGYCNSSGHIVVCLQTAGTRCRGQFFF